MLRSCLILLSLLTASTVWANSRITIKSLSTGQDPYVIVYESKRNEETELAPGIYAQTKGKEKLDLILPGKVADIGGGYNGILAPLQRYSAFTGREELLTILDGKLTLFSNRTDEKKKDSYIVIGSKQYPLVDALTGQNVELDILPNTESVEVVYSDSEYGVNILFSVKQKNHFGSGLTFVASVAPRKSTDHVHELKLIRPPTIIDYNFLSKQELQHLVNQETVDRSGFSSVLSRVHLLQLQQPKKNDNPLLVEWKKFLAEIDKGVKTSPVNFIENKGSTSIKHKPVPYYNFKTDTLLLSNYPSQVLVTEPFPVIFRADPIHGHSGIFFSQGFVSADELQNHNSKADLLGNVDFDSQKKEYKIWLPTSTKKGERSANNMIFMSVDNTLQALFRDAGKPIVHYNIGRFLRGGQAPIAPEEIRSLSFAHRVAHHSATTLHHIVVSYKTYANESETVVFLLSEGPGPVQIQDKYSLSGKYYSQAELDRRILTKTTEFGGTEHVLFDMIGEPAPSGKTKKTPYLNLTSSNNQTLKQSYLQSLEHVALNNPHFVYREYNEQGAFSKKSGFYLVTDQNVTEELAIDVSEQDEDRETRIFIPGKLLKKPKMKKGQNSLDYKVLQGTSAGSLVATMYASNPNPNSKNTESFQAILDIETQGDKKKTRPTLHAIDLPFSFDRLQAVKIIQGRRDSVNSFSAIFFVSADDQAGVRKGQPGVYIVPMTITSEYKGDIQTVKINTPEEGPSWVNRMEIQPNELKDRIAFDGKGHPYWIINPKMQRHMPNFSVYPLEKPSEQIYIHRQDTRVNLKPNEFLDDTESNVTGYQFSNWLIYSNSDIKTRFPKYKAHFDAVEKNKRKFKRRVLFPALNEYLEQLATPETKREHTVLLVEDKFKEDFMKYILTRMMLNEDGLWSTVSEKGRKQFNPHVIDASVTVKDVRSEMEILSVPRKDRRNLVFMDAASIFAAMGLQHTAEEKEAKNIKDDDDEEGEESEEADEKAEAKDKKEATAATDPKTGTATSTSSVAESDASVTPTLHIHASGNEDQDEEELLASEAPQYLFRSIALEGRTTSAKTLMATPVEERFKVPTVIVATPQEWRALRAQLPKEEADGLFDTFDVNPQFLTSSWTVWPAQSGRATEEVRTFSQTPISKEEFQVFKALEEILLDSTDKKKQAKHRIVVVPEELKTLVNKLIMSRWASENKTVSGAWNFSNPDLALFKVDPVRPLQSKVFDNYEAMEGSLSSRQPVLIGDLGDILKIGRPSPAENQKIYRVKDPAIAKKDLMAFDQDGNEDISTDKAQLPHMMWLIAAEGEEVQPAKSAEWSISSAKPKRIPTIIIATAKELATLKVDTAYEGRFIDWQKEFDILQLNEPTTDVKIELLQGLFRRHDIESLNYKFANPEDKNDSDPRMTILSSIVSSTLYNAKNTKMEPTAAFLRVFTEFRRALTEDNELRRSRTITPTYISRLFARVFPIPLNYNTFEEGDATRKLLDPNGFMHEMSEAGYDAPAELKMKAIDAWNRKTRSTVAGRNVPSSMVFFGGTSTGKTFLFDTFMNILELKEYRMDHPTNDDAGYIKIKVENLSDEKAAEGDTKNVSVDDALAHIENLLCQPKGPQAHILFDDLHKAKTTSVLKKIIAFTERLFEAKDGIMKVKCMQDGKKTEYREIPVRNITLALTINPTADREKKERFEHDGDVVSRIIAALARDDFSIEDSYFARYSTILNMDEFPRDAKVSSLARAIRDANRQEFGSGRRFVMVAPALLDSVVESFPKANAREFLNAATHNMANIPPGIEPAPLYIKDMSRTEAGKISWDFAGMFNAKQIDSDRIDAVLQDRIALRPVTQIDISSKVEFMSVIINSFRVRVYEELLMAGKEDTRLIGNPDLRETLLVSFMLASISNMMNNTHVPLKRVRAIADDFNASNDAQRRQFEQHMGELSKNDASFFKLNIPPKMDSLYSEIESFMGGGASKPEQRTRRTVLSETTAELNEALRPLMAAFFRIQNIQAFHSDHRDWFAALDEKEPKELLRNVSAKMMSIYFKYRDAILDSNVLESFEEKQVTLNDYDIARLFYLCLDRALVDLPWGQATQFTVDIVDLATRQMQLGQIPEFQHFAFVSNFSPLFAQTPQNVLTFGASVKEYRDFPERDKVRLVSIFDNNCERFLSKEGGSNK